jgi:hypothetical protein
MRERIFVGITSYSGEVPMDVVAALLDGVSGLPYRFTIWPEQRTSPIDLARNCVVKQFLASACDSLLFLDDDTVLPENIGELFKIDSDIVSGLYYGFRQGPDYKAGIFPVAYTMNEYGSWATVKMPVTGVVEVDAAGTGCLLIGRHVLEDRRMWLAPEYIDRFGKEAALEESDPPPLFKIRRMPNGAWITGEDLDFCSRAKSLGYSIRLHADVVCGHLKKIDIKSLAMAIATRQPEDTCSDSSS